MSPSLWTGIRTIFSALPTPRRREALVTCGLMIVNAFAEAVSLGAVFPFLAVVTDTNHARSMPVMGTLLRALPSGTNPISAAAIGFLSLLLLSGALRLYLSWRNFALVNGMAYDLAVLVFRKVIRQPYRYYLDHNSSRSLTGFDMINALSYSVLQPGVQALAATVVAIFLIIALIIISPLLASVAALVIVGSYVAISIATRPILERNSRLFALAWSDRVRRIQEAFGGIRNLILDKLHRTFEDGFDHSMDNLRRTVTVNAYIGYFPRIIFETVAVALVAATVWVASSQPAGLMAMVPVLGAVAACGQRLLPLLQSIYWGLSQMRGSEESVHEVARLVSLQEPHLAADDLDTCLPLFSSVLTLRDVGFSFEKARPIVTDLNLAIRKGERVGIVGPTGSGKSTLMDLLLGLLPPTRGHIELDGRPLENSIVRQWQKTVAHVPQSIFLADDTLAANIAFGQASDAVDLERVHEAAERAGIAAFIASLPDGYATVCGERGVRLSGGQRQRIGIARALYKQASFLVFDEATSALDSETERQVMAAIAALSSDITVVIVAHRLTTLADCDRIVHLASGRITRIEESRPALA